VPVACSVLQVRDSDWYDTHRDLRIGQLMRTPGGTALQ
jgi:hypothetical protein